MIALVEFLRARLDADNEWATLVLEDPGASGLHGIARRFLVEVEAKRQLVSQHIGYYGPADDSPWPVRTLTMLALPYADHPDYREEWRP